jgi:hypothetical protein
MAMVWLVRLNGHSAVGAAPWKMLRNLSSTNEHSGPGTSSVGSTLFTDIGQSGSSVTNGGNWL